MQTMYPGIVNSPVTELAADIDDTQTSFDVQDGAALPDAPNLAVIGQGAGAETVLYTAKTGNTLSGVTRGFQGTAASHPLGTKVARNFTEYDYAAILANINKLDGDIGTVSGDLTAHEGDTNNPHGVTKAQVGLGSVQNYGMSTQAQAEAGTATNVYVAPANVKQYVDKRLLNNMIWRINNGMPEWSVNGGGAWNQVGKNLWDMTRNEINVFTAGTIVTQSLNVVTLNGSGVLSELSIVGIDKVSFGIRLIVDGVTKNMYAAESTLPRQVMRTGGYNYATGSTITVNVRDVVKSPLKYNTSLVVQVFNTSGISENTGNFVTQGVYYT